MVAIWTGMVLLGYGAPHFERPPVASAPPAQRSPSAISNTRTLLLNAALASATDPDCIECWITADDGDSWSPAPCWGLPPRPLVLTVPADGAYGVFLIAENAAGRSSPPPFPGDAPHVRIRVDSTPPIVQLHSAIPAPTNSGASPVEIRLSAVDENLAPDAIRVYYRTPATGNHDPASAAWTDGGPIAFDGGAAIWLRPQAAAGARILRVVATDRAGNVGFDEISLAAPSGSANQFSSAAPADLPAANSPPPANESDVTASPGPIEHVRIEPAIPVAHIEREPAAKRLPKDAGAIGAQSPTADLPAANRLPPDQARALLDAAQRHMSAGEFPLAAARLEEYAQGAEPDADVLARLGNALYQSGRTDDAIRRFEEALARRPDHADALDGAALAEATAGRYAAARERLGELLRLRPGSADAWLHLGDVENRLGNLDDALAAWRRTVELNPPQREIVEQARKRLRYFAPTTRPAVSPRNGEHRGR